MWEPQLMPGGQGEAMLVCFFWMPGSVIGSTAEGSFAILDPMHITEQDIPSPGH